AVDRRPARARVPPHQLPARGRGRQPPRHPRRERPPDADALGRDDRSRRRPAPSGDPRLRDGPIAGAAPGRCPRISPLATAAPQEDLAAAAKRSNSKARKETRVCKPNSVPANSLRANGSDSAGDGHSSGTLVAKRL